MNKLVDSLENEMPPETDDDNFEIEVSEPQQLRAEDFSGPWRGTIKDVTKKFFSFGECPIIWFEEIPDYFFPFNSHLATLIREIGSKRRYDWIGTTIELSPATYKNKAGETKHIFGLRVIKASIPKSDASVEEPPSPDTTVGGSTDATGGGAVPVDDEVPY